MTALPLIPLRDISLLPGVQLELLVGRPGTLSTLDRPEAELFVFARQADRHRRWPQSLAELLPLACTGRVLRRWQVGPQRKILVEGVDRVHLQALLPQLLSLSAHVTGAPAALDEDTAEAGLFTYASCAESLGLPAECPEAQHAIYRLAHALGDARSSASVLDCQSLPELLSEVLDKLDSRAGLSQVH